MSPRIIHIPLSDGDRTGQAKGIRHANGHNNYYRESVLIRSTAEAGIWTEFNGNRGTKSKPIPGPHVVYGFLTTSPNASVEPIHPKAIA
jgi:putative SOS response-associated peptidase YedK